MKVYLFIMSLFFCCITHAQNTVTGSVTDSNKQPIPGASIKVIGDSAATTADSDGNFKLSTSKKIPYSLEISSLGYSNKKVEITSENQKISVSLSGEETQLNEIVVSASRTPERVLESPVTIERMGVRDIKRSASPTFYDGLENLKEVHMNTSSLAFKSINTRGFATVANTRFMQLVDGMDNSSPLLNFVLGNLIGVSEIDVQNVELLPGASSALYGANAFNGILFMNSKSPFTNQGISAYVKYGQTNQQAAGSNNFYDYGIRVAHAFSSKFAAKANFTFLKGTDWYATNYDDKFRQGQGITRDDPSYEGINVYGDEVSTNIKSVVPKLLAAGVITPSQATAFSSILPDATVSRTGYNEVDLTDNKVTNAKVDFSLHYKPFGGETELIWQSKFGFGNSVYQGASRYYLNNFFMQQHKLEFKGKNFFIRGYTTTEDGGQSYDMLFTGININRKWSPDGTWFGEYAGAYVNATLGGQTPQQAQRSARAYADRNRFIPGTDAFKTAFNSVIAEEDITKQGSKLVDNSRIYHVDANYNFKDLIKFAEIQVGGSYRKYRLNSHGRIYTDDDGPIYYTDYGLYTQLTKKFLNDRLKFTGSARYDKSKNFDGSVSPRLSLVYSGGEAKNHNFRASYQTGFRNPSTQEQYIGFNIGNIVLIGSAKDNLTRYSETLPVADGSPAVGQLYAQGATAIMTGVNAYNNSYTAASVQAFSQTYAATGNQAIAASKLRKTDVDYVKPEQVKAFEVGYRTQIKDFSFDINAYYNTYNDFIGNLNVVAPYYGKASNTFDFAFDQANGYVNNPQVQSLHALANENYRVYQLYTNTDVEIKSLGFGVGITKKIIGNFEIGANYNYAQFEFDQAKDPSFEPGFNTPKHRVKGSFGNDRLFKNFGFMVSGRWTSEYLWQSTMVDGTIDATTVFDAQINYAIPSIKSVLKLGAANLGGKDYTQVLGAGQIGQQYFASWTINP